MRTLLPSDTYSSAKFSTSNSSALLRMCDAGQVEFTQKPNISILEVFAAQGV